MMNDALGSVNASLTSQLPASSTITGTKPAGNNWGWLPALSLTSAFGVFLVALASEAGRVASPWTDPLYWLGLSVLFFPIALRLLSPKPARRERIALIIVLESAIYLFRNLEFPLSFVYNDEFIHWRGTQDLATSGHLFVANPLLPISPFYPGLEILTNALSSLTGLSIFVSGLIVLGVSGLVLVLSLYLLYEYLSSSARLAGIATLLYAANPNFFGNTGFAYESLALPLAAFVVFAIVRRSIAPVGRRVGPTLLIWLGLAAVVITHHVTSYMLMAFLLLWSAVYLLLRIFLRRRGQSVQAGPGGVALLGVLLCVVWLQYTGDLALGYLSPYLNSAVQQFMQILSGESAPRQLFHDASGFVEPLWERVTAFASVGLILLGLPFGLLQVWRRYRANAAAFALALGALAYPLSQIARLTSPGQVIGGRTQAYLFVAVTFVLAVGMMHFWAPSAPKWRYQALVMGAIMVVVIGGWVLGTSPLWWRLPGPYLPSADHRSIEPDGVTAAKWARSCLGPGQRMIADTTDVNLMATYGYEQVVTAENDHLAVPAVFLSPHIGSDVEALLRRGRIQDIVVDQRLSTGLPRLGYYFEESELEKVHYNTPIAPALLTKFDGVKDVSRIYDNGHIVIYDVETLTGVPKTVSAQKSSCGTVSIAPGAVDNETQIG